MKVAYIGWLVGDNIGDRMLYEVFEQNYHSIQGQETEYITADVPNKENVNEADMIVLGGGSLLLPGYINKLYSQLEKGKKVAVWGTGYDWVDRTYIDDMRAQKDVKALWEEPERKKLDEIVRESVFFYVRGPLTCHMVKNVVEEKAKVKMCGDPGLLWQTKEVKVPSLRMKRKKCIAINYGTSMNCIYGENEEKITDELAKLCNILLARGLGIYLYSVWSLDKPIIEKLYEKIIYKGMVQVENESKSIDEQICMLKQCELAINFKLHPNVLAGLAGIPFIALGYRFKCYDLMDSLGLSECIIGTDEEELCSKLLEKIEWVEARRETLIETFNSKQAKTINILKNVFD